MEQGMALSGEEANHAEHEHEGPAPPSEVPHEPMGKKFSEDGISKGSSQDGTAPVKGSPVGRCTPSPWLYVAKRQARQHNRGYRTGRSITCLQGLNHHRCSDAGLVHGWFPGCGLDWACSTRATTSSQWAM